MEIQPARPIVPADVWASGAGYEHYVGRWSRPVARQFLPWLGVAAGARWLEVGCGTGALTEVTLQAAQPQILLGVEPSGAYLSLARQQVPDARVRFVAGEALALPVQAGAFDGVVSGLVINFVSQPGVAVAEMARATRPGGLVAAYVWDYAGQMQFMRHFWNAAVALDPAAAALDEGRRFPLCQPGPLVELWRAAGLRQVETVAIDISTVFSGFDDYWAPFTRGQGPAPTYAMSLSEDERAALRERLRAALPYALDGSVPLVARAWAVRGIRPETPRA